MGLFDLLRGKRNAGLDASAWDVRRDGSRVLVVAGKHEAAFSPAEMRCVRVVPLGAGAGHGLSRHGSGWQVAVHGAEGDLAVGRPLADWRAARDLAQRLCHTAQLPLDEASERLFSQVERSDVRPDAPR